MTTAPAKVGGHGKFRTAIGADDRVHCLPEHVKGNSQGDIKEVFFGMTEGFVINPTAKHGQDRLLEEPIDSGKQYAGRQAENNGIANAAVSVFFFICTQADTYKGTAAVTNQHSHSQCYHSQRKDHGVGCIAVGAQIGSVSNKNLIDDVIQCSHQQGNNTGDSIFPHKFSDWFRFQKRI